jgi:two-component system, sensor histidine kinase
MTSPPASSKKPRFLPRLKINAASIAVLSIVSLLLALVPVLMIQLQKSQLMQIAAQSRVDSVLWITYQFEREHSRLRMALRNVIDNPSASVQQDLALRYDIFFSRFDLVKSSPSLEYLHGTREYRAVTEALDAFVNKAEPVIGGLNALPVSVEAIKALLQQANSDEEALRDLTNFSTNTVSREIDARNATIRNQSLYIFGLAALQWLILSGALVGLILYVRRQRQHNLELTKFTRRLHQASRRADSANQAKSIFLANMSHELRTPFQGLLGMLNLLSDTTLSRQQEEYAHTALTSARHLLGILNDILDISTIESGTMKLRLAPVHLGHLLTEVEALMQVSARDKQLALTVLHDPALPVWMEADATRLSQILFNLLSNAIKFSDEGQVLCQLSLLPASKAGNGPAMQISVKDTGMGMDASVQEGLFTRFHQADNSTLRRHGGTGLGLEITRNLVRMMDGHISVASSIGVGTEFTVVLPLHAARAPAAATGGLIAPERQSSLRILVADDHPINSKYLCILLKKMGHLASCCDNGVQAVDCVRTQAPDVVLMDLHMPVMDGISATRAVRQLGGNAAKTKIIMVSADILNDTRQSALDAGVDGFIAKPVLEDGLRKALALLDAGGAFQPVPAQSHPADAPAANSMAPGDVPCVHAPTYNDFVDLMPSETLDKQLRALFGAQPNDIQAITTALALGQRNEAGRLAHQLKGVCMLMGFTGLSQALADIEQAAAGAQETLPSALAQRLVQAADDTLAHTRR